MTIPGFVTDPPRDDRSPSIAVVTWFSFASKVLVSNSKSVVHLFIWVTILRMVGDHPWVGG